MARSSHLNVMFARAEKVKFLNLFFFPTPSFLLSEKELKILTHHIKTTFCLARARESLRETHLAPFPYHHSRTKER